MACYCPDCLINALADKINAESVIVADSVRRDIARLGLPSEPKERIDYYFDKAGLIVMTKWYTNFFPIERLLLYSGLIFSIFHIAKD